MTDQRSWFSVWIAKEKLHCQRDRQMGLLAMGCGVPWRSLLSGVTRARGSAGSRAVWALWGVVPQCSAAHRNLNSTTWPWRSHVHFSAVVQNSLQNCSVCHGMEIVDDTLIVLIRFEYLRCQQGTSLIGERKGRGCVHLFLRASHRTLTAVI